MKEDPKGEALEAIEQAIKRISEPKHGETLAQLRERADLTALLGYAMDKVIEIQELKRVRKPK